MSSYTGMEDVYSSILLPDCLYVQLAITFLSSDDSTEMYLEICSALAVKFSLTLYLIPYLMLIAKPQCLLFQRCL